MSTQLMVRPLSPRLRAAGYWAATACVAAEMGVGGGWDIARLPFVRDVVVHLGYPSYFLVLLGTWKVLGAAALLVPRRTLLKEWAYAGAFFAYTGALVSHLTTRYGLSEVPVLAVMVMLTITSWALRPPTRRGWMPRSPGIVEDEPQRVPLAPANDRNPVPDRGR
jgi:hypothetical protein